MHLSFSPYMLRAPPIHSILFDHPNNICWVQIIKHLVIHSSPPSYYLIPVGSTFPPQHPILESPTYVLTSVWVTKSNTPIQNNSQNYSFVYLNLYIWDSRLEDKRFCTEW
jgi:hypothetical protein